MRKQKQLTYVADFETVNDEYDCRVWIWGIKCLETTYTSWGYSIKDFYDELMTLGNCKLYFHNLQFDGEFILYELFRRGLQHHEELEDKHGFTTLIDDVGTWYTLEINDLYHVKIYDSFKLIPYALSKMAKTFKMDISKGDLNYNLKRSLHYCAEKKELDYLLLDLEIPRRALLFFQENKMNKMTIGSNALSSYKQQIGIKNFKYCFPILNKEIDKFCRASYKGGVSFLNPKYANMVIVNGIVFDVNSLYPSRMRDCLMPYGEPVYFKGKYVEDNYYPLYIVKIRCIFEIKDGYMPTIQIKNSFRFSGTEYLTSSNDEEVTLTLTSVDLKLFLEHYYTYDLEYVEGFKFKGSDNLFKDFVNTHSDLKIKAEEEGNMGMRELEKLLMNNSYGKFGTSITRKNKIPYLDENGFVKYQTTQPKEVKPIYIPVASFITSYARDYTIRNAQKNYEHFIYCDTDSLHLVNNDNIILDIHATELGKWKQEATFSRGLFLGQKRYIEETENGLHVVCASMPHKMHDKVTFDNFKIGAKYDGKLKRKRVKNGVILQEEIFTLK